MPLRTVLFDLDGTLADTAPDLAFALNQTLEETGHQPLPFERIRPVVSHGGTALLHLGFGLKPGDEQFDTLRARFLDIYVRNIARETRLFEGMGELLETLEENGLSWGVVTNKPEWLTFPLMEALKLSHRAGAVVCGDTLPERKPHPAPMLLACRRIGCAAGECVYVGDAERDIVAGRNAGMRTLAALFGYLDAQDTPAAWGADGLIHAPLEVLEWLPRFAA